MNAALGAALLAFVATAAAAQATNPLDFPQPDEGTDFYALVEIPAGSFTKYETDNDTGFVVVDRFMPNAVAYPANYGSVPDTRNVDGDPLDVLVYTREPVVPGALIKVRAIGVLGMIDGGEQDDKIIAVPASDVDATYDEIQTVADLPQAERDRLAGFFDVYKLEPGGSNEVRTTGYQDAAAAQKMVADAIAAGNAN